MRDDAILEGGVLEDGFRVSRPERGTQLEGRVVAALERADDVERGPQTDHDREPRKKALPQWQRERVPGVLPPPRLVPGELGEEVLRLRDHALEVLALCPVAGRGLGAIPRAPARAQQLLV